MVISKIGLQNLTQGNKPWAAGHLGHPRVPSLSALRITKHLGSRRDWGLHSD